MDRPWCGLRVGGSPFGAGRPSVTAQHHLISAVQPQPRLPHSALAFLLHFVASVLHHITFLTQSQEDGMSVASCPFPFWRHSLKPPSPKQPLPARDQQIRSKHALYSRKSSFSALALLYCTQRAPSLVAANLAHPPWRTTTHNRRPRRTTGKLFSSSTSAATAAFRSTSSATSFAPAARTLLWPRFGTLRSRLAVNVSLPERETREMIRDSLPL